MVIGSSVLAGYKFSLSDVLLNGIDIAEKIEEPSILIWSTCDIQLNPNFFQTVVNEYRQGFTGMVHPNINYSNINDLSHKKGHVADLYTGGIDLFFFDTAVLFEAKKDIIKYRFYDWGFFEYFLVALSIKYAKDRINLFSLSKIKKVFNDRNATREKNEYFDRCTEINYPTLINYVIEEGVSCDVENVMQYRAHKKFHVVKKDLLYIFILYRYKFNSFVKNKMPKIWKSKIFQSAIVNKSVRYIR